MILTNELKNRIINILTDLPCDGDDGEPARISNVYFDGDVCKFDLWQDDGCEYTDFVFTAFFPVNSKEDYLANLDLTNDEYDLIYNALYNDSMMEAVYVKNAESLNEAAQSNAEFFAELADKLNTTPKDVEKSRLEFLIDVLIKIFSHGGINKLGNSEIGDIDITPKKLEATYNTIIKFDRSYFNGSMALANLGITNPAEFAEFITSPIIYKKLTKTWGANIIGAEEYINARKLRNKEEGLRKRHAETQMRFLDKIETYAKVALELFDYDLGKGKAEDIKFAKSITDLGEEAYKEMFVVRSRYYDNIPCIFVEFKSNIKDILELEEGSTDVLNTTYIPQYGDNVRLQANVSTLLDYLYLYVLINDVYIGLKELLADCDEGFNPRWIPAPCYIGRFVESPVPSSIEEKNTMKRADKEEKEDDLGLAESINDKKILKRLVESYGKEDVLNYVRHLNESILALNY